MAKRKSEPRTDPRSCGAGLQHHAVVEDSRDDEFVSRFVNEPTFAEEGDKRIPLDRLFK